MLGTATAKLLCHSSVHQELVQHTLQSQHHTCSHSCKQAGSIFSHWCCDLTICALVACRRWHVQSAIATRGEGLYEGLDWLSNVLKSTNAGRPA